MLVLMKMLMMAMMMMLMMVVVVMMVVMIVMMMMVVVVVMMVAMTHKLSTAQSEGQSHTHTHSHTHRHTDRHTRSRPAWLTSNASVCARLKFSGLFSRCSAGLCTGLPSSSPYMTRYTLASVLAPRTSLVVT